MPTIGLLLNNIHIIIGVDSHVRGLLSFSTWYESSSDGTIRPWYEQSKDGTNSPGYE